MGYLIVQILVFLILAALLGFVVGWFLRGVRVKGEIESLDTRWRRSFSEVEAERDRFASEFTVAKEARGKLQSSLTEAQKLAEARAAGVEQAAREKDQALAQLAEGEQQAASARTELEAKNGEIGQLQTKLRRLQTAQKRADDLQTELDQARATISSLEARATPTSPPSKVEAGAEETADVAPHKGAFAGANVKQSSRALELAEEPPLTTPSPDEGVGITTTAAASPEPAAAAGETSGTPPPSLAAPEGSADDLKKISGVGPGIEKTLNKLGIFHYHQIAAFTPDNIAWVDRHLRFKGRIEREKWIDQAKTLAAGGSTEFSRR